jgi:alpha-galactosidase
MKITLIGAGSYVFAPTVIKDLLEESRLENFEFMFCDINLPSAQLMAKAASKAAEELGLKITVFATDDRKTALLNSDYVITAVAVQGTKRWLMDYEVCKEENIPDLLRECGALGGITYGMRNATLLVSVCRDMESLCPNAVLMNVSNPLTKVQTAICRYTKIKSFGFCNASQGGKTGHHTIAGLLDRDPAGIEVMSAGINHFAWVLEVKDKLTGDDLLPLMIKNTSEAGGGYRNHCYKIYERYGAFHAAPGHHEEFLPAEFSSFASYTNHPPFHGSDEKRRERINALEEVANGQTPFKESVAFENGSWERPGLVISALINGGDLYLPMLNFPNYGREYMPQLPEGNIIEVPVMINGGKMEPKKGVMLPEKAAGIVNLQSNIAELIASAAVKGDRDIAHHIVDIDVAIDSGRKERAHRALDRIISHHLDLMPQFE